MLFVQHYEATREPSWQRRIREAGNEMVRVFVQDLVPIEWQTNLESARKEGKLGVKAYESTSEILSYLGHHSPQLQVIVLLKLIDSLEQLSKDLLNASHILDRDFSAMSSAIDRVVNKKKPSKKGEIKDCHILCHALELCRLLGSGYPKSRVLVSSNFSDFANQSKNFFHPDIAPDATRVGLKYADSLEAAYASLQNAGEIP